MLLDRGEDFGRLGEAPDAGFARLGHLALRRSDEEDAVGAKLLDVAAGRRMRPHLRVHGRRHEHRPVARKQDCRREIVGEPVRHLGEKVGGRRRDDDEVGLARQPDVADRILLVEVEEAPEDALAGDGARRKAASRNAPPRGS